MPGTGRSLHLSFLLNISFRLRSYTAYGQANRSGPVAVNCRFPIDVSLCLAYMPAERIGHNNTPGSRLPQSLQVRTGKMPRSSCVGYHARTMEDLA